MTTIWGKPFELLIEGVAQYRHLIFGVASFFHCDSGWARSVPDENMTMQNTATVHLICHDDALSPNLYNMAKQNTQHLSTLRKQLYKITRIDCYLSRLSFGVTAFRSIDFSTVIFSVGIAFCAERNTQ